jgi:hypothetical protein
VQQETSTADDEPLAEGGRVSASHGRVLAIDEGSEFLAAMVDLRARYLDVDAFAIDG